MAHETIYRDVACTRCGCVCDDLDVTVDATGVAQVAGACVLSEDWFLAQRSHQQTTVHIDGEETGYETAIDRAARTLASAKAPLIYGLSESSTAGQRAATRLADQLGALLDTTASQCHAPSIMAIQTVGESTCTLGEARHRCDLVIFWGCDPQATHPRHGERYSIDPPGMFLPGGRSDRHIVVVDSKSNSTAAEADTSILLPHEADFELIWELRSLLKGETLSATKSGVPLAEIEALLSRMRESRSGIIYFGLGIARAHLGHLVVEGLLRLVSELNEETRFYARRLRVPGDVVGADSVVCWQTGYPFAVNLNRGFPRYSPGEYTADMALQRNEVDACMLVGAGAGDDLSPKARATLASIPTITITSPIDPIESTSRGVRFSAAIPGIHTGGTIYRMDEVPIPVRGFLPSSLKTDAEIIGDVSAAIDRLA